MRTTGPLLDVSARLFKADTQSEELHGWQIMKDTKRTCGGSPATGRPCSLTRTGHAAACTDLPPKDALKSANCWPTGARRS